MRVTLRVRILVLILFVVGIVWAMAAPLPRASAVGRLAAAVGTPEAAPISSDSLEVVGLVERPGALTLDNLRRLPHESVDVTYETFAGPERHRFTGVRLYDVLQEVGVIAEPGDRTPLLRRYLVVTAKDGYRVVVSGGELDPNFGDVPMLLAWERDGQPLPSEEEPLELVVPGDKLVSRYVYGVVRIEVLGIESALEVGG